MYVAQFSSEFPQHAKHWWYVEQSRLIWEIWQKKLQTFVCFEVRLLDGREEFFFVSLRSSNFHRCRSNTHFLVLVRNWLRYWLSSPWTFSDLFSPLSSPLNSSWSHDQPLFSPREGHCTLCPDSSCYCGREISLINWTKTLTLIF